MAKRTLCGCSKNRCLPMTDAEKLEALDKLLERWDKDHDEWREMRQDSPVGSDDWVSYFAREVEIGFCIRDVRRILK